MEFKKFQNILKTSLATILGQLLNLLLIPILSRIYPPDIYTHWVWYLTIVTIIGGVSTARYSDALVLIKTEGNANLMFTLCLVVGLGFSVLTLCLLPVLHFYTNTPLFALAMMPISVFSFCVHQASLQVLVRNKSFSSYSLMILSLSVLPGILQVIGGVFHGASYRVIVISGFLGQVVAALLAYQQSSLKFRFYSFRKIYGIGRLFSQFPRYSLGFTFFSLMRVRALYLIFGLYEKPHFLGLYAQSDRILNAPSSLLGASVRPIFFKSVADIGIHRVAKQIVGAVIAIWLIGAPFVAIFMFHSKSIMVTILGAQWIESAWIFKLMLIPSFLLFSTNWLDRAYDVLKIQRAVFYLELVYGSIAVSFCAASILLLKSSLVAVTGLSIIFTIYSIHWLFVLIDKIGESVKSMLIWLIFVIFVIFGLLFILNFLQEYEVSSLMAGIVVLSFYSIAIFSHLKRELHIAMSVLSK